MIRWPVAREQRSTRGFASARPSAARRAGLPMARGAMGLVAGLLALAALWLGLLAASAQGGAWLGVRSARGPFARPATALQALPADPSPLPGAPCRVVGGGLTVDAEPGDSAWGPLQNAGGVTVTLTAVEVGWTGAASLVAVLAREGEARRALATGAFRSPALVTLDEPLQLGPGQTVELGIQVVADDGGAPWVPNLLVGYLAEGCRVALRPATAPRCPLTVEAPVTQPGGKHVDVAFRNAGAVADTIVALEIEWPAAANGGLRALTLDDAPLIVFDNAMAYAPATIDLTRWLRSGIQLPPGRRVRLGLEFENAAATRHYAVSAVTQGGCTLTSTTLIAAPDCGVTIDAFKATRETARLRLGNPRDVSRALTSVEAFWPARDGAAVIELLADGKSVWRGRTERSPAILALAAPVIVAGRSAVELTLRFDVPTGGAAQNEGEGAGPGGAFTLVAEFDGGCRVVYTSVAATDACDLSSAALVAVPSARAVTVDVTNGGVAATLQALAIGWNARNGALTGVEWAGVSLLAQPIRWSAAPYTLTVAAGTVPALQRNAPAALRLTFSDGAAPDGYALEMRFAAAGGAPCDTLWVTVPERAPETCLVAIDDLEADGAQVLAVIRNAGTGAGDALRWLELAWPGSAVLPALVEVSAQPDGAAQPRVLWTGLSSGSGARIDLGGVAQVAAGGSTLLRLRFAAPLTLVGDAVRTLTLTVGFESGCRARSALPGGARPDRVSFDGVVIGPLPTPLTRCCWRIQRLRSDDTLEVIDVQIGDATRIEPPGISPRPGDPVSVEALVHADGRLEAERVTVHRASRRVRLMGSIQRIGTLDANSGRPSHIVILDRVVRIDAATLIQGQLVVEAYALVEGEENADTTLTAATIVTAQANDDVTYVSGRRGVVQDAVFVGSEDDCVQRWRVDHYVVNVPRDAWSEQLGVCIKPARGDQVEISGGRLLAQGQAGAQEVIDATGVRLLTRRAERQASLREVTGRLVAVPDGGLLGTWRLALPEGGELAFEVRSLAVIDMRIAPPDPEAGVVVHARLQEVTPGVLLAQRVRTDWAD